MTSSPSSAARQMRQQQRNMRVDAWRAWNYSLLALVFYGFTAVISGVLGWWPSWPAVSLWDAQQTNELLQWFWSVGASFLVYAVAGVPLGVLVAFALGHCRSARSQAPAKSDYGFVEVGRGKHHLLARSHRRKGFLFRVCWYCWSGWTALTARAAAACFIAGLVIWLVTQSYSIQSILIFLAALPGCLLGVWFGSLWQWGRIGRIAIAVQLAATIIAIVGGGYWLSRHALADKPISYQAPKVTSAAKREVVERLQRSRGTDDNRRRILVSQNDANFLLAWGLSLGSPDRKAKVEFGEDRSEALISIGVPWGRTTKYLNICGSGQLSARAGRVSVDWHTLEIGRIGVPRAILQPLTRLGLFLLHYDPDIRDAIESIDIVKIDDRTFEVVGLPSGVTRGSGRSDDGTIASLLAKLGDKPEVVEAVRVYTAHLVDKAPEMPVNSDERFQAYLTEAFRLAQTRSRHADAALENRAAILALGILLGHHELEMFVGPITDNSLRWQANKSIGRVTIHGRGDWTRHFFVSAALAVLSADFISDAAGLLKEELDADGGSGFSFADLAADRAGLLFAMAATKDKNAARHMQDELANEFSIDAVFPHVTDLPEKISDAELQSKYGGVGGQRYDQIVQEIERRLAKCKLLQ